MTTPLRRQLLLVIGGLALGSCTSLRARAYAGLTQTELQGEFALDASAGGLNLGTNRIDVEREAGLDDRELSPYVRAEVGLPIGGVTISGFDYTQTGSGTLGAGDQFGDIPAGTQVSSYLKFTNIKAAVHFDLLSLGVLRLSPGVGADFVDLDVTVSDVTTNDFERVDNEVFVPMVFAQAELDFDIVSATLDIGYMQASIEDARGRYVDIEALVRLSPAPFLEIFAGYRLIELDAQGNADERRYEADVRLHGWMLGGGVVF